MDKDSVDWRRRPHTKGKDAQRQQTMITEQQIKHGVLDGSITSAAWDTECTYHAGLVGYPFIQKKRKSTNIFALADGHPTSATTIALLEHKIREPARTVNMVPLLANQSLRRGGNFEDAGYVSLCDGVEVNIYDGHTAKITVSLKAGLAV